MSGNIFSTYSQGENRVTSTIIQVLRNLPINVVERFLDMFTVSNDQNFFSFVNQVHGAGSVPDAEISSNFRMLFETKIAPDTVNIEQLEKHLKLCADHGKLVYLTPDSTKPKPLEGKDVIWRSFWDLNELIDELIASDDIVLSERDQFLLKNLQIFFDESGLLPVKNAVVIVAARNAWPVYLKHGVYVCQANRSFRHVDWLGFYYDGKVESKLAKIHSHKDFMFPTEFGDNSDMPDKRLIPWLNDNPWAHGKTLHVFDISGPDDNETVELGHSVKNDLKNSSGRGYAYTQGQRYTTLDKVRAAKSTTALL